MTKMRIDYYTRDDFNLNRLFLYLKKKGIQVETYRMKKPHVIIADTNKGKKVIKAYRDKSKIEHVYHFLSQIQQEYAVNFETYPEGELYIKDRHLYWAMLPFVKQVKEITYESFQDREAVLQALTRYHRDVQKKKMAVYTKLPKYDLILKWKKRLSSFQEASPIFREFNQFHVYEDIVTWGERALVLMERFRDSRLNYSIIHGDVASHNFLKTNHLGIVMIDFDLSAKAPALYDYIQLVQRFLPYVQWSMKELLQHPKIKELSKQRFFLASLLFPSMLMRNWNINASSLSWAKRQSLMQQSVEEWSQRTRFYRVIYQHLQNLHDM
ncbi:phosphotransferase [Priestia aryabhattai]|uniref:phosphotransferase n=1 Tax=Priestia megaterium TaxID=1404 RepID=UPI0039B8A097